MTRPQKIDIGPEWEAVGPFPSGMREHPLLASALHAFPGTADADPDLDFARRPYGEGDWPSELPSGGRAGWARFTASSDGVVAVSFPAVQWDQLRADRGWASLQYAAYLRTRVLIPPGGEVLVDAFQATEYAFVADGQHTPPVWHNADVYAYGATPLGVRAAAGPSNFAAPVRLPEGSYTLLVRAIYECRMFGDPGAGNPPVIKVTFRAWAGAPATLLPGLGVWPDALDGWLAGAWASVPVRAGAEPIIIDVDNAEVAPGVLLATVRRVHIQPYQTRPVALKITQTKPLDAAVTEIAVPLGDFTWNQTVTHASTAHAAPFKLTFASPAAAPRQPPALVSLAVVVPPAQPHDPPAFPVFLALHGAGVWNEEAGWAAEMPSVPASWVLLPSGRNEWGEDWHGGSMADVWAARDALAPALAPLRIVVSDETVPIGHSNGGQGVWHLAARYPDRIRGAIVAAGYLKIQDYVPYTEHTGWRYADPALAGILLSALAPYNNDLYASNLASVPVLAIHGGADDNVPPRHGRAHVALVSAWTRGGADIKFVEFPGKEHYWPGIFREDAVKEFIASLPPKRSIDDERKAGFTLATANPDESGGKGGIRIAELRTPGRLARLDVNAPQWRDGSGGLNLHGTNIKRIEVEGYALGEASTTFEQQQGEWKPTSGPITPPRAYGPVIRLLASRAPIVLVVPEASESPLRAFAVRYANDLYTYHRVDANVLGDGDALRAVADGSLGPGSVVALGRPDENRYSHWLIAQERIPLAFPTRGVMTIHGAVVYEKGAGIVSLVPHPTAERALGAIVAGNDDAGFAGAARLLPLRTGVPVPDWAVTSSRNSWQGAGGLIGAGWWSGEWGWSGRASWLDRE